MKYFYAALCCFTTFLLQAQQYKKIHQKAIVADTHNDILEQCIGKGLSFDQDLSGKTQSDLKRFKEGGVDVQIFSIWCDGKQQNPYAWANREIDTLYAVAARNPDKMLLVKTPGELKKAVHQQKLAAMIGVEGGHMMEGDLHKLDSLYERGVRYMTLTWNNSPSWATSAMEETHDSLLHQPKGLSNLGKEVVQRMNTLGMMVDLSHVGEQTFWDAIKTTTKPVLLSHSSVYALCPVFRNLKDDQIKAVAKNGGVIDINFYSGFLDSNYDKRLAIFTSHHKNELDSLLALQQQSYQVNEYFSTKYPQETNALRPPLSLVLDHIDYIVKLVGVDYVGLGSDFDGINNASPLGLDGVQDFPLITKELAARGYSKKDIRKIVGGNFLRVFKANMK